MSRKQFDSVEGVRAAMRAAAQESGMDFGEIGANMGYAAKDARKAVWRLLNPKAEYDPKLSTVVRFAAAIGKRLKDFVN